MASDQLTAAAAASPVVTERTRIIARNAAAVAAAEIAGIALVSPTGEVRNVTTFGVLELILHPNGYDWALVPVAGGTFTDSGSQACHATPPASLAVHYATRAGWPATDGLSVRRVSDRPDD